MQKWKEEAVAKIKKSKNPEKRNMTPEELYEKQLHLCGSKNLKDIEDSSGEEVPPASDDDMDDDGIRDLGLDDSIGGHAGGSSTPKGPFRPPMALPHSSRKRRASEDLGSSSDNETDASAAEAEPAATAESAAEAEAEPAASEKRKKKKKKKSEGEKPKKKKRASSPPSSQ